jgi:helix-turn-helix protein
MKSEDQIQDKLERALKALHAVADLCSPNEGKEMTVVSVQNDAAHEEYLTVRQAAERIKYREQTIRNMMSTGVFKRGLHYLKRRRRVVFLWSSLEQWLREDSSSSPNSRLSDSVTAQCASGNGSDQPFYPVHHARSRKRRQAVL